jgi:hypothetical protein
VRALVQSKIQELSALRKNEELLQIEVELRHALKEAKLKELQNTPIKLISDEDLQKTLKKSIELEVELEDLKIQRAHEQVDYI